MNQVNDIRDRVVVVATLPKNVVQKHHTKLIWSFASELKMSKSDLPVNHELSASYLNVSYSGLINLCTSVLPIARASVGYYQSFMSLYFIQPYWIRVLFMHNFISSDNKSKK